MSEQVVKGEINEFVELSHDGLPDDSKKVKEVGISYIELMNIIPTMDIPEDYINKYEVRKGTNVEELTIYAIRDFANMLAISTEVEVVEETDQMIRVKSIATNQRYDMTHEGVREQLKNYPDKVDYKTGEVTKKGTPIANYFEIAYVTAQRNSMKGLIPVKRIVHLIKLSRDDNKKDDKFIESVNRIKDASESVRQSIIDNKETLTELGISDAAIFNKGKQLFGDDVLDWGAGQYKQLAEMVKNPTESGLSEIETEVESKTEIEGETNQEEPEVAESDLPPSVEEDPDVQEFLEEASIS